MQVQLTPQLSQFLDQAASQGTLAKEDAAACKASRTVEWAQLKSVHATAGAGAPSLRALCSGGGLALAPRPRHTTEQTPEFRALMADLARKREQAAYDAMLADIGGGGSGEPTHGTAAQYRRALAVGTHILITMAAFYAFGHVTGRRLLPGAAGPALGGGLGMTLALLLEAWLFIIRTSAKPKHAREAAARTLHARMERQVQRQRREEPGVGIDRTGQADAGSSEGAEPVPKPAAPLSRQEKKDQ